MNSLIWFRQDLRLADNHSVVEAFELARQTNGQVKAIFIASTEQWKSHDVAPIQVDFIERHVNLLAQSLAALGVELEVITLPWFDDVMDWMPQYLIDNQIDQVFATQEPEFNERKRDQQLIDIGVPIQFIAQDCIVAAGEVTNLAGKMYKVFTPFSKTWREIVSSRRIAPVAVPAAMGPALKAPKTIAFDYPKVSSQHWLAGEAAAKGILDRFCANNLQDYLAERDFPALDSTSRLSPYLAIGVISANQCLASVLNRFPDALVDDTSPAKTWVNELAWREFYRHLLVAFPDLSKGKNFNENGSKVNWRNHPQEFKAWCDGVTGFPIVDAAMRQLNQTGWMHNRLRMVVASFLTKHLLVDWRRGERYFRQHLIDGDLAANNGGWQWSAGTGCDAQPYFRVFNPMNQSSKFDPDASFIKHYIPELASVSLKQIHQPIFSGDTLSCDGINSNEISEQDINANGELFAFEREFSSAKLHYPSPIVEHAMARKRAIEVLSALKR
ncbi:cryptochrome/photolyase family protein [Shewanella sp. 10N.286.48.B5]|uniref:cryptochrome/photolyase family protein n=1 Tax=Shewanella sp. 10N.286.48.B5 TaxID=1880834 RepID=UPI000C850BDD|nr:FAD-binding domain-containing protein [Shewanella sp. 10N.286.48.B5]PMH86484.1 deoxyribodipyrimidine photolyase [Shewanella sp. 10N.286.48.B5]